MRFAIPLTPLTPAPDTLALRHGLRHALRMASIQKRGTAWRAELYKDGKRESQSFPTKAQAIAWAHQREAELIGERLPDHSLKDALRRYAREVAPTHKGERWELLRCAAWERLPWASRRLASLGPPELAAWRDERLRAVSAGTVRREMGMLRGVFDVAIKEWHWLRANPLDTIKKPPSPASRKRRITQDEADRIVLALGYDGGVPETQSHRVALAFQFALETAMRSGEILGLTWETISTKSVRLPETKNGDAREVPLSLRAREIVALLPKGAPTAFDLTASNRDALFRKARDRAEIVNLTFHDSRAEAIWRLSKKLDVMDLARVIGHRDLRSLLIYYNASADDLADRLG